jgi:hypothetical protein
MRCVLEARLEGRPAIAVTHRQRPWMKLFKAL